MFTLRNKTDGNGAEMVDLSLLQVLRRAGASCTRINNPCLKKRKTRVSEFKWLPAKRLGQPRSDGTASPPHHRGGGGDLLEAPPTSTPTSSHREEMNCSQRVRNHISKS